MNGQSPQPIRMTRHELYERVWQTPMDRLAKVLGLSGNGLAKICRRLAIPYPGRGYWARKAAGRNVSQTKLGPTPDGTPAEVTIRPTPTPPPSPEPSPEWQASLASAREIISKISVPKRLGRPHPRLAAWIKTQEQWQNDPWRRSQGLAITWSPIERRRHRIIDTLFKVLEPHGFKAEIQSASDLSLEIHRERIEVQLKEKLRHTRRLLTEDERTRRYSSSQRWTQETSHTGLLSLRIRTHLDASLRHEWLDQSEAPIEMQISEIAATFLMAADILKERRRRREEAEQLRMEEMRRQHEEEQERRLNDNRLHYLMELAERWKQAETLRQFLDILENATAHRHQALDDGPATQWCKWARDQLQNYDPLSGDPELVFRGLAEVTSWTYRPC